MFEYVHRYIYCYIRVTRKAPHHGDDRDIHTGTLDKNIGITQILDHSTFIISN